MREAISGPSVGMNDTKVSDSLQVRETRSALIRAVSTSNWAGTHSSILPTSPPRVTTMDPSLLPPSQMARCSRTISTVTSPAIPLDDPALPAVPVPPLPVPSLVPFVDGLALGNSSVIFAFPVTNSIVSFQLSSPPFWTIVSSIFIPKLSFESPTPFCASALSEVSLSRVVATDEDATGDDSPGEGPRPDESSWEVDRVGTTGFEKRGTMEGCEGG